MEQEIENLRTICIAGASSNSSSCIPLPPDLRKMVGSVEDNAIGTRDKAIVLTGYYAGCGNKELVSLSVGDCKFSTDLGVSLKLYGGDTVDMGYNVSPDICGVRTLKKWIDAAGLKKNDPVFVSVDRYGKAKPSPLSAGNIHRLIQKLADAAGLDSSKYNSRVLREAHIANNGRRLKKSLVYA